MKYLEGIRWYNKGKLEPYVEPLEVEKDLSFICINAISNLFIIEERIDDRNFIFYNDFKYTFRKYRAYYPTDKEIEEIYNNKHKITTYRKGDWPQTYWKDLPDEIKDRIK